VRKHGDACKCGYDSGLFASATKNGTIKTFWNLADGKTQKYADAYWGKERIGNGER
jgi:hypothetical protein